MSSITSPILLDSTGKETNEILQKISDSLLAANTLIDDDGTYPTRTWSSEKIVESLTTEETISGTSQVEFKAIAATPLQILTNISNAPVDATLTMVSSTGTSYELSYRIPTNGTYNWATGEIKLSDGTTTQLAAHPIKALDGTTTLTITNVSSIEVSYKTLPKGGATFAPDIISGGSAEEDA